MPRESREPEKQQPTELDSYCKYCSDDIAVIDGIFQENKLRFTQPWGLNDPLEGMPSIRFENPRGKNHPYEIQGQVFPSQEFFYRIQIIESMINRYGMLSLTKVPNSFEMWSLYANGHKGFMMEFAPDFNTAECMRSNQREIYPIKKISYVADYAINLDRLVESSGIIPREKMIEELFLKKTTRWKHEREYRIVRPLEDCPDYSMPELSTSYRDAGMYLFDFSINCLLSVTFGAHMSPKKKKQIRSLCKEHSLGFYQACIVSDQVDELGRPGKVVNRPLEDFGPEEYFYGLQPQQFLLSNVGISEQSRIKLDSVEDLPYYRGHERIVEIYQQNLAAQVASST